MSEFKQLERTLDDWCVRNNAEVEFEESPLGKRFEIRLGDVSKDDEPALVRFIDVYPMEGRIIIQKGIFDPKAAAAAAEPEQARVKGTFYTRKIGDVVTTLDQLRPFAAKMSRLNLESA